MRIAMSLRSLMMITSLAGAIAAVGCASDTGNPTGTGATPSAASDQRTDNATRAPDVGNGGTGTGGAGSGGIGGGSAGAGGGAGGK